MDKVMEVYEKYVPNTYTPEPSVTLSILQAIHFSGAYKYLPRLASDVLVFEQSDRENILTLLTEAAATMKHEDQ
ncbi:Protein PTCD3-like protein, mitochondrial, partial [Stegodyphus mimosarum]